MENEEQQHEREQAIKSDLDQLDEQGDRMDEKTSDLERKAGEAREDYEAKRESSEVPGLQPDEDDA